MTQKCHKDVANVGSAYMYNWIGVLYINIAIAYGVDTCTKKQSYN